MDLARCPTCDSPIVVTDEICGVCTTVLTDVSTNLRDHLDILQENLGEFGEQLTSIVTNLQSLVRRIRTENQAFRSCSAATEVEISGLVVCEGSSEICAICAEAKQDDVRQMPCGHSYHTQCIGDWLRLRRTCPECRRTLS
jgi:hypothetical protein